VWVALIIRGHRHPVATVGTDGCNKGVATKGSGIISWTVGAFFSIGQEVLAFWPAG